MQKLLNLKDPINKIHQIDNQLYFSVSETTSPLSIKGKQKLKKSYTNKPVRLYNWNQPIKHIENYTLTVTKYKNDSK